MENKKLYGKKLHYQNYAENSDKIYVLWVEETPSGEYVLQSTHGRRGNRQNHNKPKTFRSEWEARRAYNALLDSKVNRSRQPYSVVADIVSEDVLASVAPVNSVSGVNEDLAKLKVEVTMSFEATFDDLADFFG